MFENIVSEDILNELLKHAGISTDNLARKNITDEKVASEYLSLQIKFVPHTTHYQLSKYRRINQFFCKQMFDFDTVDSNK